MLSTSAPSYVAPGEPAGPSASAHSAPATSAPASSAIARSSRIGLRGLRLRGTSRAATGCRVTKVRVAIGRKVGSGCRFLRANGRFGSRRSCLRTQYITARGTNRWTLRLRARLPRGSYLLWSRAIDNAGTIERKFARRNLLRARVGRR